MTAARTANTVKPTANNINNVLMVIHRIRLSGSAADRDSVTVVKKLSGGNQFHPFTFVSLDGWGFYLLSPLQSWMRKLGAPT